MLSLPGSKAVCEINIYWHSLIKKIYNSAKPTHKLAVSLTLLMHFIHNNEYSVCIQMFSHFQGRSLGLVWSHNSASHTHTKASYLSDKYTSLNTHTHREKYSGGNTTRGRIEKNTKIELIHFTKVNGKLKSQKSWLGGTFNFWDQFLYISDIQSCHLPS